MVYASQLYAIAQDLYQRWLKLNGVQDTHARIEWHPWLGYVGVLGEKRRQETQRAYDTLPSELIVEINRAASGLSPLDVALIKRLMEIK